VHAAKPFQIASASAAAGCCSSKRRLFYYEIQLKKLNGLATFFPLLTSAGRQQNSLFSLNTISYRWINVGIRDTDYSTIQFVGYNTGSFSMDQIGGYWTAGQNTKAYASSGLAEGDTVGCGLVMLPNGSGGNLFFTKNGQLWGNTAVYQTQRISLKKRLT
jgi:hypothetical protein